jgi:hypothetical protein
MPWAHRDPEVLLDPLLLTARTALGSLPIGECERVWEWVLVSVWVSVLVCTYRYMHM